MTTQYGQTYKKLDIKDETTRERAETGRHKTETQEALRAERRGKSAETLYSIIQALLKGMEEQKRRTKAEEQERQSIFNDWISCKKMDSWMDRCLGGSKDG